MPAHEHLCDKCVCVHSNQNLERVLLEDAAGLHVLPDLVEDAEHGDVGLAGTGGRADQQVLVGVVGRLEHDGLDAVQTLHPLEHQLPDLGTHTHTHTHTHTQREIENGGNNEFLNQPLFYARVLSKLAGAYFNIFQQCKR